MPRAVGMLRFALPVLLLLQIILLSQSYGATTVVSIATDAALGPSSLGTPGGQKLLQDSTGRTIAVYIDTSGRIGITYANTDPTTATWATPVKSPAPTSTYARPAAVLVSLTSLRIIVEGGTGTGNINDLPVTLSRDSSSNIVGVQYGSATVLDASGFAKNPSAILAHNGNILAAWNWMSGDSRVKTFRWISGTGWRGFTGSSTTPDDAIMDSSNPASTFPNIIQRRDNNHVYVLGTRSSSSTSTTLVFNKATFNGSGWSWGTQNLSYETNAARGAEDAPSLAWDPVKSMVVVAHDISGSNSYSVFTLDSSDKKTHMDTPSLIVSDNDWGMIGVDGTGQYFLFLLDAGADGGSGRVGYTSLASGSWSSTLTVIDSDTNNIGLSLRSTGTTNFLDLLYSKGTTTPTTIRFARNGSATSQLQGSFSFTPISPTPAQTVTFSASASGGTSPYSFSWNFGDGATATGSTATHAYSTTGSFTVTLTVTDSVAATATSQQTIIVSTSSPSSFKFLAAGDYGFSSKTTTNWNSMSGSGANFVLALGDLLYDIPPPTEQDWCNSFKSNIPNVELIVGNHETLESNVTFGGATMNKFIQSCPFTLGSKVGVYGYQYYFDYPATSPVARFIMVMPGIWNGTSSSSSVSYGNGTATQAWVGSAIDSARSSGIPWVIVGFHKNCISAGTQPCESGQSFMRFLINKKVDLVLEGHDHNYQRSKQLKCATADAFDSSCVVNDGSSGVYGKNAGTVFLIDGTGGEGTDPVSTSDPEFGYFAKIDSSTIGYTKYTVSSSSIQATFVPTTGSFTDSWSIVTSSTPDYSISASPSSITINQGSSGTSTITLSSLAGFSGTVSLSRSSSPTGLTTSLSTSSVSLSSGGTATSTLTVSSTTSTPTGSYTVTVTGTSGSLTHSVTISVSVSSASDFSISASPTTLSVQTGSPATSDITLTSLSSFSGTVSLTASSSPPGPTTSLSPTSVSLTSGGLATSVLTFSSSTAGTYTVTIAGTSGSLSHSVQLTVTVTAPTSPDFTISATPSSLEFTAGSSGASTIAMSSLNGFSGTISLVTTVSPSGLTASLSPVSITMASGSTGTSILTVNSATSGTYTVTVTGTSGGLTHSVFVTVTVTASTSRDFTISSSPSSLSLFPGSSGTSTITFTSLNSFRGTIDITTLVTPSSGLTVSCTPTSVRLSNSVTSATSTCTFSSSTAGNYAMEITGTSRSLVHTAVVTVNVVDFSITASPSSLLFIAGSSSTSTITITGLNGFSGTVSLTTSAPADVTASLSPISIVGSGTSTLTVSSTKVGNYTVTVTGTSGPLTHSVSIILRVVDFSITASSVSITTQAGQSATSTLTLSSLNGFTGNITLSTSASPSGLTASLNPAGVMLGSGASTTSTLTVSSGTATTYTLVVTAISGSATHSITITVKVVDFSISASPSSLNLALGSSATSSATFQGLNGFTGAVTLTSSVSPSTGLSVVCSPTSLSLSASITSAVSNCTLSSSNIGSYIVTLTGTSGSLVHSATLTVVVSDFTIAASPSSIDVPKGFSQQSVITLTSLNGFTGTVSLTSATPSGLTASLNPSSVALSSGGSATSTVTISSSTLGSYTLVVTATSGSLSHSVSIVVRVVDFTISSSLASSTIQAGSTGTSNIALTSLGGFSGTVSLSSTSSPSGLTSSINPATVTLTSGGSSSATVSFSSGTAGTYVLTVTGANGPLSHSVTILVKVIDFSVSTSPSSVTIPSGSSANSTITLTSLNGFAGTISLTSSVSPATGLSAVCSPTSVSLSANATSSSTCNFTSSTPGTYTVTITGTSGSLTHSKIVTISVVDFTLSASPTSVTFFAGSTDTSTITATSVNGFSGTVQLSASSPSGLTASLSPSSITLSGGSGQSTLTLASSTPGTYTITVTGTSGLLSHLVTITVQVVDFQLTASPSSLTITQGDSATTAITVNSLGGFSGTLTLTDSSSPTGPRTSLNPKTITLGPGGSATSILKITIPRRQTPGTYTITVTATTGSISRSVTVTVTVPALAASSTSFLLSGTDQPNSGTLAASQLLLISMTIWNSMALVFVAGFLLLREATRRKSDLPRFLASEMKVATLFSLGPP